MQILSFFGATCTYQVKQLSYSRYELAVLYLSSHRGSYPNDYSKVFVVLGLRSMTYGMLALSHVLLLIYLSNYIKLHRSLLTVPIRFPHD
jgi:hypothetical protein